MRVGSHSFSCMALMGLAVLSGCKSDDAAQPNPPPPPPAATYTVGGTVTGLAGSVTLANNGGDARTVSANGAFNFATPLAGGGAYVVTVTTQPPTQVCSIGAGSGTIAAANVASVTITCVTKIHTVGGTVSGLQGSGLVLQNNAGDNLARAADGAFTFSTPVESGTAYNVTVLTQPANPAQICTPANNTGTAMANVGDVTITCAPPAIVPSFTQQPTSQSVEAPAAAAFTVVVSGSPTPALQWQLSTDSGANWSNIAGATTNLYSTSATAPADSGKRYRAVATNSAGVAASNAATLTVTTPPAAGKSWRTPVLMREPAVSHDTYGNEVVMNARGDAVVVWERLLNTGSSIWANRYVAGSGWQGPQMLSSATAPAFLQYPKAAINASGDAVVVWEKLDPNAAFGGRTDIHSSYYSSAGWGSTELVETDDGSQASPHSAGVPFVTLTDAGLALAVWNQGIGTGIVNSQVLAATSIGGAWSSPHVLAASNAASVRLAGVANGNAAAAWLQYDGAQFHVYASRFTGGGWGGAALVDHDITGSSGWPAIGVSANGDAVVAWAGMNLTRLVVARYNGGSWAADLPLSSASDSVTGQATWQVVMDANGNAIVKWTGSGNKITPATSIATLISGTWSNQPTMFFSAGGGLDVAMNAAGQSLNAWNAGGCAPTRSTACGRPFRRRLGRRRARARASPSTPMAMPLPSGSSRTQALPIASGRANTAEN